MGDIFDLSAERARRAADGRPVVAVLSVSYVLDDDGVPMCSAAFSVDRKQVEQPEQWLEQWLPATAQHLLDVARKQNSTSES
jgi:hypothetical protein